MKLNKLKLLILTALIIAIISIYPSTILAQTVAVTGTITDTQTTPYSNGLLTVTFVNSTGQQATFGGNPSFQKSYAIYLDANGSFTISLPPNSTASPSVQPSGTQWNFSYQSQGGYGAANINVTITGAGSISGTLSNLARITWPYGNIPPPGASGQGIVFVSSTTLGWGTTGTAGAVTHTAGNLTLNSMMLGNGVADAKVDSACVTNGTGALSGCTSIATTGSISTGSGASSCGAGTTACFAGVEAATACTPTAGQICKRFDSVTNNSVTSANGAAEVPDLLLTAPPAGSKCLQTSGTSGGVAEAAAACNSGAASVVLVPGTTAANTIAPTANSVIGLTVLGTTGTATDLFDVCTNAAGACGTKALSVDQFNNVTAAAQLYGNYISTNGTYAIKNQGSGNTATITVNPFLNAGRTITIPDASGVLEMGICANVAPVTTAGGAVTTDQNMQACTLDTQILNLVGRTIKIHSAGTYTTAAVSSSAMTIEAKLCTVSGCGSGTVVDLCDITTSALGALSISGNTWMLDCIATTQTTGASSVYERNGSLTIDLAAANTAADTTFLDSNATAVTAPVIANTGGLFLQIAGAFSVANASNVFVGRMLTVEITQ